MNDNNYIRLDFLPLLTLIFITLKLCKVINWSWWWVLSPLLIPISIVAILWAIVGFVKLMEKRGSGKE
jgi:hypothetical protein